MKFYVKTPQIISLLLSEPFLPCVVVTCVQTKHYSSLFVQSHRIKLIRLLHPTTVQIHSSESCDSTIKYHIIFTLMANTQYNLTRAFCIADKQISNQSLQSLSSVNKRRNLISSSGSSLKYIPFCYQLLFMLIPVLLWN